MPFASSISPERRARLRRLRAEFEAAFDLVGDREDRASPAYRTADACYRAWIGALDGVAMALLDDIDAYEAASTGMEPQSQSGHLPKLAQTERIDVLLWEPDEHRSALELIGAAPATVHTTRKSTPKSRAMSIVGEDRVARHWSLGLGRDHPDRNGGHAP